MKDQNFKSINQENDDFDLGRILRFILMQSKLIATITLIGFAASVLSNIFATKQYSIQSLLQYESFNQNILDPSVAMQASFAGPKTDILNLITLYESRTNLLKLIKDLRLNLDVKGLKDDESIDINVESKSSNEFEMHNLHFSLSNNGYTLLDNDEKEIAYSNYGEYIYFNDLEILIHSSNISEDRIVEVDYRHPESMYNLIKSKIVISTSTTKNSFYRSEGLITVSYTSDDRELGKNIVNYANEIFLNQRISVETEKSRKALDFINNNLKLLKNDFENKKIKLNRFREKNKSIDVGLEIQSIISKIEAIDQSIGTIDLAIAKAKEVYTENNVILLNLLNEKRIIEKQKEDVMSVIELMPKEQQEYIDLFNDVEVTQALFEELETRRLGLSILEASTIGDIRIVDKAYYVAQVSPKFTFIVLFTFLSLAFACLIAIVRGFLFLPISNPAELFDNNIDIPIIGVIPLIKNIQNLNEDTDTHSSFESLILNIDSMNTNQTKSNLITITSPSPGNGKSTSSSKLAEAYSKLGKKVLLIDGDFKRGKLGKSYNVKSIDKKAFFSIDESNIDNFARDEHFYFIPRVNNLNDSFEFLYNNEFKQKITFFKEYFDYVILDTAPILSISDTSILVEISDFNILIARHATNRITEIKQAIDHFGQIGKSINGIIYNAYEKPKSYYGYYGLYGNYSYQYYAEKYLEDVYDYKK